MSEKGYFQNFMTLQNNMIRNGKTILQIIWVLSAPRRVIAVPDKERKKQIISTLVAALNEAIKTPEELKNGSEINIISNN